MNRIGLIGAGVAAATTHAAGQLLPLSFEFHPRTGEPFVSIAEREARAAEAQAQAAARAQEFENLPGWSSEAARRAAHQRVERSSSLGPGPGVRRVATSAARTPDLDIQGRATTPEQARLGRSIEAIQGRGSSSETPSFLPPPVVAHSCSASPPGVLDIQFGLDEASRAIDNRMFSEVDHRLAPDGQPHAPAMATAPPAPSPTAIGPGSLLSAHVYRPANVLREEEAQRVIEELDRHVQADPDDAEVRRVLAVACLTDRDHARGCREMLEAYRTFPPLASMPFDVEALPGGTSELRDLTRRAVRMAHRSQQPADWLTVVVLMQAEGRSEVAMSVLDRAERSGLDRQLVARLRETLREGGSPR